MFACKNHNAKQMTLPTLWAKAAKSANLALLVPKPAESDFVWVEVTAKQGKMEEQRKLLDKTDLMGLWDWSLEDPKQAFHYILEDTSKFALHDRDFCKMSLVKHSIRLTDNTPFREFYGNTP